MNIHYFPESHRGDRGFTLLELVLATFISSMVIAIASMSLSFSLRVWERHQERESVDGPQLIELLNYQMGFFESLPLRYDDKTLPFFVGDEHSLALATDYSVRSLSKGAPVIARYVYDPDEKKLYYAEIPLDPYHPEPLEEFMKRDPTQEKDSSDESPVFYFVEMQEFSFEFIDAEDEETEISGEDKLSLPAAVLVKWSLKEDFPPRTHRIVRSFPPSPDSDSLWSDKKKAS